MLDSGLSKLKLRRFARREDGGATIEAVLWFPVFFLVFVMLIDAATIFMNQARILRVVQDGNRLYAVNFFSSDAAFKSWVETSLDPIAPNAVATPSVSASLVSTTVTVPASDIDLSGVTGLFRGLTFRVQAQQLREL
jgi:hypothetical protein